MNLNEITMVENLPQPIYDDTGKIIAFRSMAVTPLDEWAGKHICSTSEDVERLFRQEQNYRFARDNGLLKGETTMAILQTKFKLSEDGWTLVRTISDRGMMVRQDETGELYAEAVDPEFTNRTYTETDIPGEKIGEGENA